MRPFLLAVFAALALSAAPAVLALAPPARAAIEGKDEYPPGVLVRLAARDYPPDAALLWRVTPDVGVDRADTAPELFQFIAPPGTYLVDLTVLAVVDAKPVISAARKTVKVVSPTPPMPKPTGDIRQAIGKLRFDSGFCSATIVLPRRSDGRWEIACAAHCVSRLGQRATLVLRDGRQFDVEAAARDGEADVSWWLMRSASEADLPAAVLAGALPAPATRVAHSGWGVDNPGNTEFGTVADETLSDGKLAFNLSVSGGDSGGAIYRADTSEIVATVCCTRAKGYFTRMYGGSCLRLARLRPLIGTSEADQGAAPVITLPCSYGALLPALSR